ncbi:MAG: hypothetical protein Q8N52_13385 [Acidobacteriota bacterium]|nr:hypothetical protein [Acidobacteriota bacterium]
MALVPAGTAGGQQPPQPPRPPGPPPVSVPNPIEVTRALTLAKAGNGAGVGIIEAVIDSPVGSLPAPAGALAHSCGTNCGASMTRRYPRGTRLLVSVRGAYLSPGEARTFLDHIDGCQAGTTMTCRLTLENDTTITAHFRLPQLTVGVAGSGARVGSLTSLSPSSLACGAAGTRCSADVERGHVVELSASSVSADVIGFRQGGTMIRLCNAQPCTTSVRVMDDMRVEAVFGRALATLTLELTGTSGSVTVTEAGNPALTCVRNAVPDLPRTECTARLQLGAAVTIGLPRLGVTSSCGTTFTLAGDRRCVVTLP